MNWCRLCFDECKVVEESFDYAGTHCTGGRSGTHRTGNMVSDCCLAEVTDDPDEFAPEGWSISYDPKPIPDFRFDYDFCSQEYDGDNGLCGNASSVQDALDQIEEMK